jgi:hypothetical protein
MEVGPVQKQGLVPQRAAHTSYGGYKQLIRLLEMDFVTLSDRFCEASGDLFDETMEHVEKALGHLGRPADDDAARRALHECVQQHLILIGALLL